MIIWPSAGLPCRRDGRVSFASCFVNKRRCEIFKTQRSTAVTKCPSWTSWIQENQFGRCQTRSLDRTNPPFCGRGAQVLCTEPWAAGGFGHKYAVSHAGFVIGRYCASRAMWGSSQSVWKLTPQRCWSDENRKLYTENYQTYRFICTSNNGRYPTASRTASYPHETPCPLSLSIKS